MLAGPLIAGALAAAQAAEAAPPALPPGDIAFATRCRYASGTGVLLAHRFNSEVYRLVAGRGGAGLQLVTITPRGGDRLDIDAGSTVGHVLALGALFQWLLHRDFRAVTEDGLLEELGREGGPLCPGDDPFTP
jgi:hypothetical protein